MPDENSDIYARAIVDAMPQPVLVLDGELRVVALNPAFLRLFEVPADGSLGRLVYELGNNQWDIPELRKLLNRTLAGEERVEDFRVAHAFETIGRRIMLLNALRMDRAGRPDRILLAINDVTERERLLSDVEGREEFGAKLIDSIRESLLVLDWNLRVRRANGSFYDRFQVTAEQTEGRRIYELGNGQWDIPELRELLERVLPEQSSFDDFVVEHEFENIGRRIMRLNGRRLDHMQLILLAIRDTTEQRDAEIRQDALMGELQHRVKNILSNVRAIATQTRANSRDLDGFMAAFGARLGSLARVQGLLVRHPSLAIDLDEIIRLEMEAIGVERGSKYTAEGPNVRLQPQDAQAVAMTIHELATNAAKYGALAVDDGRIGIAWAVEPREGAPHLFFQWQERGVRIAQTQAQAHRGFGSRVIEESSPTMLRGSASLRFEPDGASCRLDFPLRE